MKQNFMSDDSLDKEFDIRVILQKYLVHWKWFVFVIFLCLTLAYLKLRYTTTQYQAGITILVKDDEKGDILSELSLFSDLVSGLGASSNLDNEVEILKSRTLVESTLKRLELNVSISKKGKINTIDIYEDAPFTVRFVNRKPGFYRDNSRWEFVKLSPDTFHLIGLVDANGVVPKLLTKKKEFRYGELIPTVNGDLILTKTAFFNIIQDDLIETWYIHVTPLDEVIQSYFDRIEVAPISKTSSVVGITLTDSKPKRAEVFLDTMIEIYNAAAAADKNFISENTSKFITNRLVLITQELDGVEEDVENFKQSNGLVDIESEAQLFIEGSTDYNNQSIKNEIQLSVVLSMLDFMKKSTKSDLLPANLIEGQGKTSELIGSYNTLVLERNRILKSATLFNPMVVQLDQQILSLKATVSESLMRLQSNLNIQRRNLKGQEGLFDSKIGKIPVQERQFRVIARQQKLKEELYLYLLQKREETAISLAATAPNARVIDVAKASKFPVSPKKGIFYIAALLMGFLIPFGVLYLIDLFDTKVKSRLNITDRFDIPFLGDVPRSVTPNDIIDTTSRTSTAEAIRIVRSNLDYMLTQVPEGKAKSIFVTSTIPGEGKTFLSVNLAAIFAHSDKRVLLIGMDIRKPKLNEYLGINDNKGLTDYLSSRNIPISNFINKMVGFESFDVLLGGTIPPNPTEMLLHEKVDELFAQLKNEYDYIVVDTAPVSLVSDTLIVAKHADTFAYVVRANYLDKRLLNIPADLNKENRLPNMGFILNDSSTAKGYGGYGYNGYGYGVYGYGETIQYIPWYKKIFKK
jgi:tyrosine-protein kinase Etk/Wzc